MSAGRGSAASLSVAAKFLSHKAPRGTMRGEASGAPHRAVMAAYDSPQPFAPKEEEKKRRRYVLIPFSAPGQDTAEEDSGDTLVSIETTLQP